MTPGVPVHRSGVPSLTRARRALAASRNLPRHRGPRGDETISRSPLTEIAWLAMTGVSRADTRFNDHGHQARARRREAKIERRRLARDWPRQADPRGECLKISNSGSCRPPARACQVIPNRQASSGEPCGDHLAGHPVQRPASLVAFRTNPSYVRLINYPAAKASTPAFQAVSTTRCIDSLAR